MRAEYYKISYRCKENTQCSGENPVRIRNYSHNCERETLSQIARCICEVIYDFGDNFWAKKSESQLSDGEFYLFFGRLQIACRRFYIYYIITHQAVGHKKGEFMKKITALVVTVLLLVGSFSMTAFADAPDKTITLRIEGIDENLFYGEVDTASTNVTELLEEVDSLDDTLEITMTDSLYGKYISAVNGDTESTFGGYDGWMFMINGVNSPVGVDDATIADGDEVVLYYSDAYGVGFQYPVVDYSQIDKGILTITSTDTTYDADYNPVETVNPVVGATVTWYYDDDFADFVTDEKGQITIPYVMLTAGNHYVDIEKYSDTGIPMVLRFADDYAFALAEDVTAGDQNLALWVGSLFMAAAVAAVSGYKKAYAK